MYTIIKNVILNHTYTDLNKLLAKIKRIWIEENLTEEEYNELVSLALTNSPVKDYAVQEEIDKIWLAIRALEQKVANYTPSGESEEEQTPTTNITDFVQPTGAHDAYQIGDKVRYNGQTYESLINGNVWAPDVYPAGWKVVNE